LYNSYSFPNITDKFRLLKVGYAENVAYMEQNYYKLLAGNPKGIDKLEGIGVD
jgi:hypothetical protein